jgi:prepilin-type N-terminal cleavage/methylation domain-containing protein
VRRGVTLIEMLVVVALVSLLVGVTFPSVASGVETLRLNAASDAMVSFFNEALNRAERRQEPVEITVLRRERALSLRAGAFERRIELPQGITIESVQPPSAGDEDAPRTFLLLPGGAVPRIGVEFANSRRVRRMVRVDPITGVPQVERIQ